MSSRDQLDHPAECTDLFRDTTISFTQSIFLMCLSMVGTVRLELTTYRLKADYSTIELRTHHLTTLVTFHKGSPLKFSI